MSQIDLVLSHSASAMFTLLSAVFLRLLPPRLSPHLCPAMMVVLKPLWIFVMVLKSTSSHLLRPHLLLVPRKRETPIAIAKNRLASILPFPTVILARKRILFCHPLYRILPTLMINPEMSYQTTSFKVSFSFLHE